MCKKIVGYILILGIIMLINPISAADVAQNGSETGVFNISHSVARESKFSITHLASVIEDAGDTTIGSLKIKNNTKDGFSLLVSSKEGGVLHSADNADGEVDIEYSIFLKKTGATGAGLDEKLTHSSAELFAVKTDDTDTTVGSPILSMAGDSVSSKTDVSYDLIVRIDDSNSDTMSMAGTYDDVLTLIYQDL